MSSECCVANMFVVGGKPAHLNVWRSLLRLSCFSYFSLKKLTNGSFGIPEQPLWGYQWSPHVGETAIGTHQEVGKATSGRCVISKSAKSIER